jgi:cellulose synthase/poly-beta-1,6-N-acetylglucosamine synthase-like glycosyltransferase/peptidoglycan/xylan/chitin deacetylase (PgdA/CDA1 family)
MRAPRWRRRLRSQAERDAAIRRHIRRPPSHWVIVSACVLVLLVLLLVQGFTVLTTGSSGTPRPGTGRAPLAGLPSLLVARHGRLVGADRPPGRQVALSFDDGPDPRWTPRIAAALRKLHVPATFFVVGSHAVRNPGIVRRLHRDGFELGNHTFTHVDLAATSSSMRSLQLSLTQSALAGIVGERTRLLRPPYSATPDAVTARQARVYADLSRRGYVIALSDFDSRDWSRPGTAAIVRAATPTRSGGVVLMHDAGGDRSQTVAAVKRLVPLLRSRGFDFVRLSDLLGVPPAGIAPRASSSQELRGTLLVATLAVARWVTTVLAVLLIAVAVLAVLRAVILVLLARHHVRRARVAAEESYTPPVSILVPAFNEAVGIERAVVSLSQSDYPDYEIVVVDDGSTDGTGDIVESLGLHGVRVVRQPNAGKAAALNRGLRLARHDVIVTVDADTVFEASTLRALVQPLRGARVGAVAGNTKVGNRRGLLGGWQHIEYVMGFNLDRRLYDVLHCMPTVPGAIGAFRRQALVQIGGVSSATLAEDTDITIAIGRLGWHVVYAESARAWTEAPASLSALWRQRYRWSYGTLQAVWKHRAAIVRPGEGRIGRLGIPYLLLFQVALPMLAPLIDLFAIYGLIFLDPLPVLAYWVAFNLLQLALGAYAFRLDHESLWPLWRMPLQQFVYRQLMYMVVIESVISAMLGIRVRWQHVERRGGVKATA